MNRHTDPNYRPQLPVYQPYFSVNGRAQCLALPMEKYAAL